MNKLRKTLENLYSYFSLWQYIKIFSWLLGSAVIGWHGLSEGYLNLEKVTPHFLEFNFILLGFALTSLSIIGSVLGRPLVKELQKYNAYFSLMTNFYLLIVVLMLNSILAFVMLMIKYDHSVFGFNLFLIVDITLVFLLLWFSATRFARMMRNIS